MSNFRRKLLAVSHVFDSGLLPETIDYIKTAFSTDGNLVYNDVAAYAAQNPSLIPYINQEPLIICSFGLNPSGISNGMPLRWLYDGGNLYSYVRTNVYPKTTSTFDITFMIKQYIGPYPYIFGCEHYNQTNRFGIWHNLTQFAPRFWSWKTNFNYNHIGKVVRLERRSDGKGYIDGVFKSNITPESNINYEIRLFSMNRGDDAGAQMDGNPFNGSINRFIMDGNYFVPWQLKEGENITCYPLSSYDPGTKGMLNLTTGVFHAATNYATQASTSFSINYTLPNGTSWSPNI